MLSDFVKYVKQYWHDRPDKSTPLNADRLNHIENGIGSNSEAINQIANAVVSNIVNDPEKIASMAAVYALQEKLGTGELPSDAPNAISAINTLYSNLQHGSVDITLAVNKEEEHEVVFPYKFAKIPTVMVSIERNGYTSSATVMVRKGSVTTSGFKFTSINSESINAEVVVSWFAITK